MTVYTVTSETRGLVHTGTDKTEAERVALIVAVGTGRTAYLNTQER